jgi:hypothetical protein
MTSILPHNIVNDTTWRKSYVTECLHFANAGKLFCELRERGVGGYRVHAPILGTVEFTADSLPAAKAEALRLVREAILAEAEAWR